MFCPNCGTKNDDAASKCGQCGFDLKAKDGKAKFKGTVMMTGGPGSPFPAQGKPGPTKEAPQAPPARGPKPALKGTMVGVAPPGIDELRKQAEETLKARAQAAQAQQPNSKLKGTMVGVAPPDIEEARQHMASAKAQASASPEATKPPPSKLKGTMIGLAPPNMRAEVEAAKAQVAAAKEQAQRKASEDQRSAPGQEPTAQEAPSKLKGTMIGVAPPDLQAEIAAAKERFAGSQAGSPAGPSTEQAPTQAFDATTPAPQMSPFASGSSAVEAPGAPSAETGGPARGPNELSEEFQQTQVSTHPPPGASQHPGAPVAPAAPTGFEPPHPVQHHPADPIEPFPVTKSKTPMVVMMVLLLLALIGIIVVLSMGGGDDAEPETTGTEEPAESGEVDP